MISHELSAALESAAQKPMLLVASDYDGTISPLVDDPSRAFPHPGAMATLEALARQPNVEVILISGRSLAALRSLTGEPTGISLIGTHGAESDNASADPGLVPQIEAVIDALSGVSERFEGTVLEPKPAGAALHYRHAADPSGAAQAARDAGAVDGVRLIDGKQVVELLVGTGDKGTALGEVRDRIGASSLIFFGDDTTDEDVFRVMLPGDVGVKVGDGATEAQYRVGDPDEVAEALAVVLAARSAQVEANS